LQEQIESILQQTLQPVEIIICDDASDDGTQEILKAYEKKGLIKYYANEKRLGVVGNFKKGVALAQEGNYIALSDQDDIWMPHKLATLHEALFKLENKERKLDKPCIVYSDLILVDENKNELNKSFWNELYHDTHEHCLHTLLFGNFVTGCTIMMNAATKKYFEAIPPSIMHDVWLAFVGNTIGKIKAIPHPLLYYRQHAHNQNYHEGNTKQTKTQLRWLRFTMLFTKNKYLQQEYFIAKTFLVKYANSIPLAKQKIISRFLLTQKMPHFIKEIALKIYFSGRWK
jgi:glycosyltransferase involved in cell wall biosynthesis